MTHRYSRAYSPPMPSLEIYLSLPSGAPRVGPLAALIDTGADGTLVPSKHLRLLESAETDQVWIRSQWGEHRLALGYMVDLHIGALRLPAVHVVRDDRGKEIIIGRDVLNKLRLLLDGPAETTEILEPKQKRK